jgi:hypothetical protein
LRGSPLLIALFGITLLSASLSAPAFAQPVASGLLHEKLQLACSFLKNLYNSSLQLVRSTPNSSVYYIANDNLLAEKALASCEPTISHAINQSISSCCGTGDDLMHEALLGKKIPLPIHVASISTVANSSRGNLFNNVTPGAAGGNYTVLWEEHNAPGIFPDCTYADITVYTALELKLEGNTTGAQHEMDCLAIMFDGRGMVDEPYKDGSGSEHGIYQTYKFALYLYALQKLSNTYYHRGEENLLRSQGPEGGFHTGYDQTGTYAGTQENVETTSIAIIAISNLSTTGPFPFPFFSIPPWIIYLYTGLAAAAVAVVVTVLVLEQRKRKQTITIRKNGASAVSV